MYRVMIIDDEEIVRWGIRDLLNWEKEGFSLCEDAKDGEDGLKKVMKYQPDLVLVDIKMPGMNGIDLISEAKASGFRGHFAILTGYSEFGFAKSGIRLGVKDYLLKPVDMGELESCVRKIYAELEREADERNYHSANEGIAREELLRRLLIRMDDRTMLEKLMERHQLSLDEEILCAAVLTDRDITVKSNEEEFAEKVKEFLHIDGLFAEKVMMDNQMVLLSRGIDYREWAELLEKRNERIRRKYGTGLLISVGHNVSRWYDLCYSYEFAKFMLEQEFLFCQYDVLSIGTIEEQQKNGENPSTEHICMLIEVGDPEGIRECVEKFGVWCIKNLIKELDIKIQLMYNLMTIRNNIEKKYSSYVDSITERMEDMNRAKGLSQLLEVYCQILQDICRQISLSGPETVIRRMYYYMEKNYDQDLKLESFAKMFNYNSNYLGNIFRKEIGSSFNYILDTIRIANAKRLLTETDLKAYEIAEKVGYNNLGYFHMKFKKYVGVSPIEYKKTAG